MPPLVRREVLQLSLLLLIVPIQYFLTQELQQPNQSKSKILKEFFDKLNNIYESWLNPEKIIKLWGLVSLIRGTVHHFIQSRFATVTNRLRCASRSSWKFFGWRRITCDRSTGTKKKTRSRIFCQLRWAPLWQITRHSLPSWWCGRKHQQRL